MLYVYLKSVSMRVKSGRIIISSSAWNCCSSQFSQEQSVRCHSYVVSRDIPYRTSELRESL